MKKTVLLIISILMITVFLAGCASENTNTPSSIAPGSMAPGSTEPTGSSSPTLQDLAATEVKEYEGQDLSSILDNQEASINGAQYIDISTYTLIVDGLVENPQEYTYDQVLEKTHYQKVVTLNCVVGWSVDLLWEGILLEDLFNDATLKSEANTVIFHAADGYTTSLPLQTILEKNIIMAYKINGIVLPAEMGYPFQLVAEDKLGYKWAKWITRIELSDDSDYKGYWEDRGYNNEADVED